MFNIPGEYSGSVSLRARLGAAGPFLRLIVMTEEDEEILPPSVVPDLCDQVRNQCPSQTFSPLTHCPFHLVLYTMGRFCNLCHRTFLTQSLYDDHNVNIHRFPIPPHPPSHVRIHPYLNGMSMFPPPHQARR